MGDDVELLSSIHRGDPPAAREALRSLYDKHADAVLALAERLLGDPGAAEDVLQETFLAAARLAGRFREGSARPWLLALAANRTRERLRADRRRAERERRAASPEEAPAEEAGADAAGAELDLAGLRPSWRAALELRFAEGLTHAEVAAALVLLVDVGPFKDYGEHATWNLAQALGQLGSSTFATLGPGLLAALAVGGGAGLLAAARFALGDDDAAAAAAAPLRAAAFATAGAGLLLGVVGAVLVFAGMAEMAGDPATAIAPQDLARRILLLLGGPLFGLVLGRLVLGALADGALATAGLGRSAAARPWTDVAWLATVAFPALVFFALTAKFDRIQ